MSYSAALAEQFRNLNPDSARVAASLRAKAYQALAQTLGDSANTQISIDRDSSKILAMPEAKRSEYSGKTYTTSTSKGGGRMTDATEVEMSNMFD